MTSRLHIDGSKVRDQDEVHDLIAGLPGVPDFYGRNLDAMFDVLTGFIEEPLEIRVSHPDALRIAVGNRYYTGLIKVFEDAANAPEARRRHVVTLHLEQ